MNLSAKIKSLGFTSADAIEDRKHHGIVYRIRTANGWTYERFDDEAEVDAWAANHRPEEA